MFPPPPQQFLPVEQQEHATLFEAHWEDWAHGATTANQQKIVRATQTRTA